MHLLYGRYSIAGHPRCKDGFAGRSHWNGGTVNAVFVDAHVEKVRSGLRTIDNQADISDTEFNGFEKYGWPFKAPPP